MAEERKTSPGVPDIYSFTVPEALVPRKPLTGRCLSGHFCNDLVIAHREIVKQRV